VILTENRGGNNFVNINKFSTRRKVKKSGENDKNQLLISGDFLPGEKLKKQEIPGKIRRFGNPGRDYDFV